MTDLELWISFGALCSPLMLAVIWFLGAAAINLCRGHAWWDC